MCDVLTLLRLENVSFQLHHPNPWKADTSLIRNPHLSPSLRPDQVAIP